MNSITLLEGDCLDKLKELDDNSVDSIVTDPPYGLIFMGKKWDKSVPSVEVWQECLRVLKPGGHLLAFAGTRTQHRMAVNIEDAGFEIRDMIAWVYGSGFPKSLNVSKAIDATIATGKSSSKSLSQTEKMRPVIGEVKRVVSNNRLASEGDSESGVKRNRERFVDTELKNIPVTGSISNEANQWEGWGTALKPALEPITVARKPISEKTVAANVLKYGTGGINIDASRVPVNDEKLGGGSKDKHNFANKEGWDRPWMHDEEKVKKNKEHRLEKVAKAEQLGRFPSNFIHDGSEEVVELFPESKGQQGDVKGNEPSHTGQNGIYGEYGRVESQKRGDTGSAARFFKQCEFTKDDFKWQDQNHHQFNANIAETNSFLQKKVEFFVQNLVAIADSHEDNLLKNTIQPFMNEIQKKLKNNDATTTETIQSIGKKCERELLHISMGLLKCNHVNYAEIQKLTNIMMTIQNLTNIDGFVDHVISNCMLRNMVLGEKVSRIKYSAKASKSDKNEGMPEGSKNNHVTVKPYNLMKYLVTLVTPPNGTVLDPFMGSGSTGKAAVRCGFDFIGCELDEDYLNIAKTRIEYARDNPEETKSSKKKKNTDSKSDLPSNLFE